MIIHARVASRDFADLPVPCLRPWASPTFSPLRPCVRTMPHLIGMIPRRLEQRRGRRPGFALLLAGVRLRRHVDQPGGSPRWRPVDPRIKDLLTLAAMPRFARPLAATMLRLQGQPRPAHTVRISGRADGARAAELVGRRDRYRQRFATAMEDTAVDVLVCPPSCVPAFRPGTTRELGPVGVSYTCLYNFLACPAGWSPPRPSARRRHPAAGAAARRCSTWRVRSTRSSAGFPSAFRSSPARTVRTWWLSVMEALEDPSTPRGGV
jgi:hypothetical protein